jgi:hypothetical protein
VRVAVSNGKAHHGRIPPQGGKEFCLRRRQNGEIVPSLLRTKAFLYTA